MPNAPIVTRADLVARYPKSSLVHWQWSESEDDPSIGWWAHSEFRPTHRVDVSTKGDSLVDYVVLEPPQQDRQIAYTPQDTTATARDQEILLARNEAACYAKDLQTGKWWHLRNENLEWLRARVKATPIQYMRDLPSELKPPEPVMGWVYFVEAGPKGPIKIGWSQEVDRRIEILQVANAQTLKLLGKIPGTMQDEQALHKRFAHLRIQGEWFKNASEIESFVTANASIDSASCETKSDASSAKIPRSH